MTPLLRPAEAEDFGALAELQRRSVHVCLRPLYDHETIDRWIDSLTAAKFERAVAAGEEIVVAVLDARVLGFVSLHAGKSVLGMWYVDPSFIGRGIGSSLLSRAESRLLECGCSEVTTEASLFAQPRFEARGWTVVEEYEKPAFGGLFRVSKMSKPLV